MTDNAATWIVAALLVLGALVFLTYWIVWFRQPHEQSWLPAGYREHESPFVFSDTLLALVLLATAVLLVLEEPLTFLGILDAAYFWRTGMFAPEHEGYLNLAVVFAALAGGIFLIVRYA
jgi:hypothetical protein